MSEIERKIFKEKFSKGEVKILFDGFDEISPKCKSRFLVFNHQLKEFYSIYENMIFFMRGNCRVRDGCNFLHANILLKILKKKVIKNYLGKGLFVNYVTVGSEKLSNGNLR
jgi:hypothetical protein